jgi:aminoglycoside phosphotransferase (APT) family kinase protein
MIEPARFAELKDLCLRSFPGRLDQRLSQIRPLTNSPWSGLTFALSWREGTRQLVERLLLRRYVDSQTRWSLGDERKAQREWVVMRWLYGIGLPLPRVYALGTHDGDPFLLLEHPSGQVINTGQHRQNTMHQEAHHQVPQEGQVPALGPYVDALATLLARLHRLVAPDSVRKELPGIDWEGEMERLTSAAQQCKNQALMEAVRELERDQAEALPPCVLHGDPQVANLRCDARGATAWLSWENSALGDPRWDVACAANQLESNKSSPLADQFCERYADRAGLQLSDMPYWKALTAVHRWAMTEQARSALATEDEAQPCVELEGLCKQAWQALAGLRKTSASEART